MNTVCREDLQALFGDLPWGVCPFSSVSDRLLPVRSVSRLPENAQSVLVVLFPYLLEDALYADSRLSRFAVPADYHVLCGELLHEICQRLAVLYPQNRFEHFTDASPVPEVSAAAAAGLGVVGKNGLLLTQKYGSWVFIGEIVTDLAVENTPSAAASCIGCDACIKACPTGALTADCLQTDRCLSHISQKKRLADSEMQLLKENKILWGCDRCQTVCPMNRNASPTFLDMFRTTVHPEPVRNDPFRAYAWRGDAVFRNAELIKS